VATAGRDGASIWWVHGGLRHLLRSPDGVSRLAFSSDGVLLATADQDGTARVWDARTGDQRQVLPAAHLPLTNVAFSPDGRLLVTTGLGLKGVETWNVQTGKLVHQLVGQFGTVSAAAFSPDGRWLVTAGPIAAGLWQRDSDHPFFYLRGDKKGGLTSVAFSPDGHLVLSSSKDGSVRLYRCEVCGSLRALMALAQRRLATAR
jgi:WD40 repeat protein